jgi:hypothetical protein
MPNENSAITMKPDHLPISFGPDIEVTPLGLRFHGEPDFKKWSALGVKIGQALRSMEFVVGDWLVYGEHNFKQKGAGRRTNCDYQAAIRATGIDYALLRVYAHVSRRVNLLSRNNKLSWTHHRAVAKLPPEKQKHWLDIAAESEERVTTRRLRTSINAGRLVSVEELTTPPDQVIITHIPPINRLTLWWEDAGGRDWLRTRSKAQLRNMLVDFSKVIDIIKALQSEYQMRPDDQ